MHRIITVLVLFIGFIINVPTVFAGFTVSTIPDRIFDTKSEAEAELRAVGSQYAQHQQVDSIYRSRGIRYEYRAPQISPTRGQWQFANPWRTTDCYSSETEALQAGEDFLNGDATCRSQLHFSGARTEPSLSGGTNTFGCGISPPNEYTRHQVDIHSYSLVEGACVFSRINYNTASVNAFRRFDCPEGFSYSSATQTCSNDHTAYINGPLDSNPGICAGNPCDVYTGNKIEFETDFVGQSLSLRRTYQSATHVESQSSLGPRWYHSFARSLILYGGRPNLAVRGSAFVEPLRLHSRTPNYVPITGAGFHIEPDGVGGWVLIEDDGDKEFYDVEGRLTRLEKSAFEVYTLSYQGPNGKLSRVENRLGQYLTFHYDDDGRLLQRVDNQADHSVSYVYDDLDRLTSVINPDDTTRTYHYEHATHTNALTGVTDERGIRYSTFDYDSQGRAILSTHANDIDRIDLTFNADNTEVVNSRNSQTRYNFSVLNHIKRVTSIEENGTATLYDYREYNRYVDWTNKQIRLFSKTDANGVRTEYTYNDYNVASITRAAGTPNARTIRYTYDARFNDKVASKTEPSVCAGNVKTTTYGYDNFANITQISIDGFTPSCTSVSRTTSFQYSGPLNQLSVVDGPRSDVDDRVLLNYYPDDPDQNNNRARLRQVQTASGLILRDNLQYSATGKVLSETRSNGLQLSYAYYPGNDRLQSLSQSDGLTTRTTTYTYLPTGEVETITLGAGTVSPIVITLGYDDGRRLRSITDGLGNVMHYELDSEGNKIGETIEDAQQQLRRSLTQVFDLYDRLQSTSQANETATYVYNPTGDLTTVLDGKQTHQDYQYDDLKRVFRSTQDLGGTDPSTADALTEYSYDVQDNLTDVIDPINGTTTYEYDDLGNLLQQDSADTGSQILSYDAAGNLRLRTDANDQTFSYVYDALNRLTLLDAPGTADDISYQYDTCAHGQGRVCSITQGTNQVDYQYNAYGDVISHQGMSYGYDALGRLSQQTYPSGAVITYQYDLAGNIAQINGVIDGTAITLATNISYEPFGPIKTMSYGNGAQLTQSYDQAYRLTAQNITGVMQRQYPLYDANGNLETTNDTLNPANHALYQYDALNRLTDADGSFGTQSLGYDKNGNRLDLTSDAVSTTFAYEPNANRLASQNSVAIQRDANGNTLNDGQHSYRYNTHNRLIGVDADVTYQYNALGQRTLKDVGGTVTGFAYGLSGELLGEYPAGAAQAEHIYLGDQPLAVIQNGNVYYVHTDHLGTPRVITDQNQTAVWQWESDPFGATAANDDVDGDGSAFVYNKRFAGQYYDVESGLHYNYFRYYDPSTGRYITSDPIGLEGGLNTYGYVGGNPVRFIDILGLHHGRPHGQMGHGPVGDNGSVAVGFSLIFNTYTIDAHTGETSETVSPIPQTGIFFERCEPPSEDKSCNDTDGNNESPPIFVAGWRFIGVTFNPDGTKCYSFGAGVGLPIGVEVEK